MNEEGSFKDKGVITSGEFTEMIVSETKKRRLGLEENNPSEEMCISPQLDIVNQKNLLLAGSAMQTRHSS